MTAKWDTTDETVGGEVVTVLVREWEPSAWDWKVLVRGQVFHNTEGSPATREEAVKLAIQEARARM